MINKKHIVRLLRLSFFSTILSIIPLIWVTHSGVVVSGNSLPVPIDENKLYTLEGLEEEERMAKLMMDEEVIRLGKPTVSSVFSAAHQTTVFLSWIPWLVFTILFRIGNIWSLAIFLVIPAAFCILGVFSLLELFLFSVAAFMSFKFKK